MPSYAKFDVWQNTAGVNYNAVLQVIQAYKTDTQLTNAAIYSGGVAISGLSVSITPKFTSSKILILGHMVSGCDTAGTGMLYKLKRTISGSTVEVGSGIAVGNRTGIIARSYVTTSTGQCQTDSYTYLDSPATVSLITYQMYMGVQNTSYQVYINRSQGDSDVQSEARGASSITVMEVAQ